MLIERNDNAKIRKEKSKKNIYFFNFDFAISTFII